MTGSDLYLNHNNISTSNWVLKFQLPYKSWKHFQACWMPFFVFGFFFFYIFFIRKCIMIKEGIHDVYKTTKRPKKRSAMTQKLANAPYKERNRSTNSNTNK